MLPFRSELQRGLAFTSALLLLTACEPSTEQEQPAKAPIAQTAPAAVDAPVAEDSRSASVPAGQGFDFYVLSLSWSPSYCEAEGEDANRQQCETGRPYAFVVHGLWPQFERGYPESCQTSEADVQNATLRTLYDIMPSAGLIRYQWKKHGSCTRLSQADYFKVLRAAREKVAIPAQFHRLESYLTVEPDDVERAFLQSNQGLPADGVAVTCDKRYMREVRICMTKDLAFRRCGEVDQRACRLGKAVMPPVRGG